jgi:hypothetical protein
MKTVKFVAYLFFRYYSTGPRKEIPYFSTVAALAVLFYIHLVQVLIIFNGMNLIPGKGDGSRIWEYFKMALFITPVFLLIMLFIRKPELQVMHYDDQKIKQGNINLVVYIILSFAFMIFLILLKKGKL